MKSSALHQSLGKPFYRTACLKETAGAFERQLDSELTMQTPEIKTAGRSRFSLFVFTVGCLIFLFVPLRHFHETLLRGVDFKTVYSSSKCLLDRCDPYDSPALVNEYGRGQGDRSAGADLSAFARYQALYPPSTLFWMLPFASLPFQVSLLLWMLLNGAAFVTAASLVAHLCLENGNALSLVLLGLFVATSTLLLSTAQPSALAISLCTIGVWCLLKDRRPLLGVVCFALSLALKPQLGGLVSLYFLFAGGVARRRALQILGTAALLCVPGVLWISVIPAAAHWPQHLAANIAGSSVPGAINDPGPTSYNSLLVTDLQSVIAVFDSNRVQYNLIAWALVGSLLLVWAFVAVRAQPSRKKDLLGVATIACLSLLPVYHRHYDVRLLLLTFPACALLLLEGGAAGWVAAAVSLMLIGCSHPSFIRDHLHLHQETLGHWSTVFLLRTSPLVVSVCALFYLAMFVRTMRAPASADIHNTP